VAGFRAKLQHSAPSSSVMQLARTHQTNNVDDLRKRLHPHSSGRRLTLPITAQDLRHVPDLTSRSGLEVPGHRLRSVCGQGDLRATGLQDHDESELWLARTVNAGLVPSSEDDQTSKDDTEDELSK